jgi:hypothetical protein
MLSKFIRFVNKYQKEIILITGVVLISFLSFAGGYITAEYQSKDSVRFDKINP